MQLKRKTALLLAMILPICSNIEAVKAQVSDSVQMYIDESQVIKYVYPEMYGINFEWGGGETVELALEGKTTEIREEYVKAFDGCMPQARAAGMSANRLYWKGAIGPMTDRTLQKFWENAPRKQQFGPVEWYKSCLAIDPSCKFIVTLNLYDTQENIADYVEFLLGDGTVNYNGGVNWAQERIKNGLEKPIDVFAFELANEIDVPSEGDWEIERYVAESKRTIQTIKSIAPDAKIAVMRKTESTADRDKWHRMLLYELGDQIDYIAVHLYYRNERSARPTRFNELVKDIKSITGDDRIQILITEHAGNPTGSPVYDSVEYRMPHTMEGVLLTAEFYIMNSYIPAVRTASYHCINSANWSVAYTRSGRVERTGIGDLLRLSKDYFVGECIKISQSEYDPNYGEPLNYDDSFGAAVKTDDGVNLYLVNRTGEHKTFEFTFKEGKYKAVQYSQISASSMQSDRYKSHQEGIEYKENISIDTGYLTSYTVPPYSVTGLKLVKCEDFDENAALLAAARKYIAFKTDFSKAYINGRTALFEREPIIEDGRMYLPVETVTEVFNLESFVETSGAIHIKKDDKELIYEVGERNYYVNNTLTEGTAPVIYNGKNIYLPARDFINEMGYILNWDNRGMALLLSKKVFSDMDITDEKAFDFIYDEVTN